MFQMDTQVYNVNLENVDVIVAILRSLLIGKEGVYFHGEYLVFGGHIPLGTSYVYVQSVETIKNLVIRISFTFPVENSHVLRHFLLPILQPEQPSFDVSMISVKTGKVIVMTIHVTKPYELVGEDYPDDLVPLEFASVRFIFDKSVYEAKLTC